MASIKQLHTRAACNAGATLQVLGPDGKETGETMQVLGVDSDAFRRANRKASRDLLQWLDEHEGRDKHPDYVEFTDRQKAELQATLITGWSYEDECNDASKVELLLEAPYVAAQVDAFAGKRANFVRVSQ